MHPYFSNFSVLEQWARTVNTKLKRCELRLPFMDYHPPQSFLGDSGFGAQGGVLTAYFNTRTLRRPLTSQCSTGRGFHGRWLVWWAAPLVLGHPACHHERSPDLGREKPKHCVCTRSQHPPGHLDAAPISLSSRMSMKARQGLDFKSPSMGPE